MHLAILGGLGAPELLVIALVLLLLFGRRLPEVMKSLGKGINQFKRGLQEPDDEDVRTPLGEGQTAKSQSTPEDAQHSDQDHSSQTPAG